MQWCPGAWHVLLCRVLAREPAGCPNTRHVPAPSPPTHPTHTHTHRCSPSRRYVTWVEAKLGVHCKWIGVGPGRDAIVIKPNEL